MASFTPTTCLSCDYQLTGLAPSGRCPECGDEYDENTRVWRSTRRSAYNVIDLILIVVATLGFAGSVIGGLATGSWRNSWFMFNCIGLLLVPIAVHRMARRRERGRCVAVSPQGILIRYGERQRWIPWTAFKAAKSAWYGTYLAFGRRASSPFLQIVPLVGMFDSRSESQEFCTAAKLAHDRHLSVARPHTGLIAP